MEKKQLTKVLHIAALLVAAAGAAFWLAGGAHRGWTKTSVPVRVLDDVTGIEAVVYEKRLAPGVDFLAAVCLTSGLLAAVAYGMARPPKAPSGD